LCILYRTLIVVFIRDAEVLETTNSAKRFEHRQSLGMHLVRISLPVWVS